jgi:hypothetical protein
MTTDSRRRRGTTSLKPLSLFDTASVFARFSAIILCALLFAVFVAPTATAHGVAEDDKAFLERNKGIQLGPFLYLGAKHMVTGYDHLLFLLGVIFFLYRVKEVLTYVSLFTLGHSTTLIIGVMFDVPANSYLIDAIIGFSVVYKGFDNLGGFQSVFGWQPNTKIAVGVFGLFHGFGLATKVQDFALDRDGLLANIIAFNVGVEIGQFLALTFMVIGITYWRMHKSFTRHAFLTNTLIMVGGFILIGYQLTGYFVEA